MDKAANISAEEWGDFTGQVAFEILMEVGTAGGAAALTAAKIADRTIDAARVLDKLDDLGDAAKAADKLEDISDGTKLPKVPEELGPVLNKVDDMSPGSPGHKAKRWKEYQERGGEWSEDRWGKTYDNNMTRAKKANKAVDDYHKEIGGWGKREVTVDVNGEARRLDIADVADKRGVEVKSGEYFSLSEDIRSEIARDRQLVQDGWEIDWMIQGKASEPLINELKASGIKIITK